MLARLRSPPDTPLQAGQIKGAAGGEVSGLGCESLHSGCSALPGAASLVL